MTATLYVNSDPQRRPRRLTYTGKATTAGLFGAAQGMKPFPLDAPGEYHAKILATYTDPDGHLWVCTMRHAGVVYPENSPVIARGKKLYDRREVRRPRRDAGRGLHRRGRRRSTWSTSPSPTSPATCC